MSPTTATRLVIPTYLALVAGCSAAKTYDVRYAASAGIVIDGDTGDAGWRDAEVETGFTFPWEDRPAPATRFRAVCDDTALYFVFEVTDADVVAPESFAGEAEVRDEDRVELFFAADAGLKKPYYCLEIDPRGRVSDYSTVFYRRYDRDWSCPGLKVAGRLTADGYVVEGSIPHSTFAALGLPMLKDGQPLPVGVFRAEFSRVKKAEATPPPASVPGGPPPVTPGQAWISWVDPRTPQPDFHVPGAFGWFRLRR
jgi:Carbohydrate family 9 binding domain-like